MGPLLALFTVVALRGAALVFLAGLAWRVVRWSNAPVPFHIPVTCGQQASLPWIRPARLDNPSSTPAVIARMSLEVLLFRSLVRNVRARRGRGDFPFLARFDFTRLSLERARSFFSPALGLWLAALLFHYSLLVILIRHLRFFLQPVPGVVAAIIAIDGFLQIGLPTVHASTLLFALAIGYLLVRRLVDADVRRISLVADYAILLLIAGIAFTGILMRHVFQVDTIAVKQLALTVVTFSGSPPTVHPLVVLHVALVAVLFATLPFTKLVHMAGIFLSPTRNLANTSRARRHVNPWNREASIHTYEEWEAEFRDRMIAAGLPVKGMAPTERAGGAADG